MLHALGADLDKKSSHGVPPIYWAACYNQPACVRMLVRLGANVQPLLRLVHRVTDKPEIAAIVKKVRAFLAATGLVRAEHQFALHSLAQLVAFHNLPRHASQPSPAYVEAFALRFGVAIQSQLIVAPLLVATTPARRKLVLLAARTAVDAAVKHAADADIAAEDAAGTTSIDAVLVVSVLNILLSADRVWELFNLRTVSRMTRRRSFPVPGYPLIELPTGPVEEMLVGHGSGLVSWKVVLRAYDLHGQDDNEVNDYFKEEGCDNDFDDNDEDDDDEEEEEE